MPKWRNWQTRTFEGRVRQLVGVRVPPSANHKHKPFIYSYLQLNSAFRALRAVVQVFYSQVFMLLVDAGIALLRATSPMMCDWHRGAVSRHLAPW